jgi:predicted dehydrogenase
MSQPLRFAIIGCGRMGEAHAKRLQADGRGRVVACVDPDLASAARLKSQQAPNAETFAAFDELMNWMDARDARPQRVDAAIICTPTPQHFQTTLALLDRGVHVLCEKPLSDSRARILALIDRHRSGPAQLAVAYQRRSLGIYRTLRREILSGAWGPVRSVVSHNVENWQQTIHETWRDDPRVNWGGFVGDAGSHKIDIVFRVTGLRPTSVFGRCDPCGSRVEIQASVSARLEGDVPLTMDFVGNAQYFGEDLSIHCAEADWTVRHGELFVARSGRLERVTDLLPDSDPVTDFLNMLLDGGESTAPPECALPVFDFTEALLLSSRSRLPVSIPIRGS